MTYIIELKVTVELDRTEGKFASREEVVESLTEWLENANQASIYGIGADGESTYEVINWDVEEVERPKSSRHTRKSRVPPVDLRPARGATGR